MMEWLMAVDKNILFWIQNHLVSSAFNSYMLILSELGNAGIVWIVLGVALLPVKKYRWAGIAVLLALASSLILGNGILKPLAARSRPCAIFPWVPLLISWPADYSFPSGHTFASFAAATAIFCRHRKWGAAAFLLASGIGFSRLYLFVHYPSDVVAGVVLGIIAGLFATKLSRYLSIAHPWRKVPAKAVIIVREDEMIKK